MATVRRGHQIIFIQRFGRVWVQVMKSVVIKRSVLISGRKTSVSLENEFWDALHEIAEHQNLALSALVEQIDKDRDNINLSSAIRVFVFTYFRLLNQERMQRGREPEYERAECP